MVEAYRTEEEQIEFIKKWWSENATAVIAVIVLAVGGTSGWQFWQSSQLESKTDASIAYQEIVDLYDEAAGQPLTEAQFKTASHLTEQISANHDGSQYAHYASLLLAKQMVLKGDFKQAEEEFRGILASGPSDEVKSLATLRLAKVLFTDDRADDAMALLNETAPGGLKASYEELRGDIFLSKNERVSAKESYQKAVALFTDDGISANRMLTMKLEALAEGDESLVFNNPAVAAAEAAPAAEDTAKETE